MLSAIEPRLGWSCQDKHEDILGFCQDPEFSSKEMEFLLSPTCTMWRVSVCDRAEISGQGFLWENSSFPVRVLYSCVVLSPMDTKINQQSWACLQCPALGRTIKLGSVFGFDWGEKVENVDFWELKIKPLKAVILM